MSLREGPSPVKHSLGSAVALVAAPDAMRVYVASAARFGSLLTLPDGVIKGWHDCGMARRSTGAIAVDFL